MTGKQLKNSILQWAIQGKLVPQDPNDEPASVLLERIREEKARLIKEKKIKKDKNESIIYRGDDNSHYEKILATGEVKCIDDEIPFEIPKSWEWCRVRDISQSYIGLTYAPTDVSEKGIIVLRSSNIKDGKLDLTDIVRVNKEVNEKLQVNINDIIICARNGSRKLVGKSAIITEKKEHMTFGAFMAICKTKFYNYIYLFLQSDSFFSQLRKVSGTTTINQLTQNNFNNFLVPIPPQNEQARIFDKYNELLPIIEKYGKSEELLNRLNTELYSNLKKSILQEAIQGKLVPQDSNDEPATVLLEKINSEKLRLVREGKLKKKDLTDSTIFKGDDNKYYEQIGGKCLDITQEIPFDIPNSWVWTRIKCIYQTSSGGTPEKGHPEYYGGTIPWVKVGDLSNIYISQTEDSISDLGLANSSAKLFPKDTILVAMYCNDAIGKSSILLSSMTTNQAICGLYPNPFLNTEYIYYAIQNNRKNLQEQSAGGAQKNINQKIVNNMLIPIPPIEEQMRIVEKIQRLYKKL